MFGTMASWFNNDGVTALHQALSPELIEHGPELQKCRLPTVCTRQSTNETIIVRPQRALPHRDRRDRARLQAARDSAGEDRAQSQAGASFSLSRRSIWPVRGQDRADNDFAWGRSAPYALLPRA